MQTFAETNALVAKISPAAYGGATTNTDAIALSMNRKITFTIVCGAITSGTVDFSITGCATSGGSYVAIPGTAITQITTTGKVAIVQISGPAIENLGLEYAFIKGRLVTTGTANVAVTAHASEIRYNPASDYNHADVVEIVTKVN